LRGGGVIALARVYLQPVTVLLGFDINGTIAAVALEGSGLVRHKVTSTNHLLKSFEATVEPSD
jgi:hypothetical protein